MRKPGRINKCDVSRIEGLSPGPDRRGTMTSGAGQERGVGIGSVLPMQLALNGCVCMYVAGDWGFGFPTSESTLCWYGRLQDRIAFGGKGWIRG